MLHIDLFSGIAGFARAVDEVWDDVEHIFCEIDPYCRALLKLRYPGSVIYEDIRIVTKNSIERRRIHRKQEKQANIGNERNFGSRDEAGVYLLTGGFPCQPFSNAGKRRGKNDNRYLWPEMLRVIKEFKPTWVIGENVAGITSMAEFEGVAEMDTKAYTEAEAAAFNDGESIERTGEGVLEEILGQLEEIGYEVQPFVIPACAVNAPHRRDRVWIVGYSSKQGQQKSEHKRNAANQEKITSVLDDRLKRQDSNASDGRHTKRFRPQDWNEPWLQVALRTCVRGMDDGLPAEMDGLKLSASRHRVERLKALGNAIVLQVAIEIMKAIKEASVSTTQ